MNDRHKRPEDRYGNYSVVVNEEWDDLLWHPVGYHMVTGEWGVCSFITAHMLSHFNNIIVNTFAEEYCEFD